MSHAPPHPAPTPRAPSLVLRGIAALVLVIAALLASAASGLTATRSSAAATAGAAALALPWVAEAEPSFTSPDLCLEDPPSSPEILATPVLAEGAAPSLSLRALRPSEARVDTSRHLARVGSSRGPPA